MRIRGVKTRLLHANEIPLVDLFQESLPRLKERSIIAISSKAIALCEGRVASKEHVSKRELIEREADWYTPEGFSEYGYNFTIVNNTLIAAAGIDESNADNSFVLWPENPQQTANEISDFLRTQFKLEELGVIITDSSSMPPMRRGAMGIMLAHSGFRAVTSLVQTKDLFGRPFQVESAAIGSGLAAAANVVMGEGVERTPIAIISDVPFVTFQNRHPNQEELSAVYIPPEDDLYAPFLLSAPWQRKRLT